mgnify:CR=1 FL=1
MRRWRMRAPGWLGVLPALIALGVGLFLLGTALGNLEQGRDLQGKEQLEQSIRRAAVGCYAAEGVYPPTLPIWRSATACRSTAAATPYTIPCSRKI